MKKLYFCYEKDSTGWSPVVYHNDPPPSKGVNGSPPEIHPSYGVVTLAPEFIGANNEPLFGKIQKAYPLPK